jgi:hypothetical protein
MRSCINIGLVGDGRVHLKAARHPEPEAQAALSILAATLPFRVGEGLTGTVALTGASVLAPTVDPASIARTAVPAYRAFLERFPMHSMIGGRWQYAAA